MVRDLLIQQQVLAKLAAGKSAAKSAAAAVRRRDAAAIELSQRFEIGPEHLRAVSTAIEQAIEQGEKDRTKGAFMPRDPNASILQLALEQFYRESQCVGSSPRMGLDESTQDPLSDEVLTRDPLTGRPQKAALEEFGEYDPRWVFAFLAAKRFSESRAVHPFPNERAPIVQIGDSARLVLFADWATGIRRARDVADQIERFALEGVDQNRDTHAINLGDVYYAGFDEEYRDRCLSCWPIMQRDSRKIRSWCLNGNHDMYAGGHGFFEVLLGDPRFKHQNGSSFFLLENAFWRIAGLDTAYDPPDFRGERGNLYGGQSAWLTTQLERKPAKRSMLLSHHQLFSAWEKQSPLMKAAIAPLFTKRKLDAWFWGHEHRCAVYRDVDFVRFASLIGHGGVPVKGGSKGSAKKAPFTYEYRDTHISGYCYLGFAVVDLEGKTGVARYFNERGDEHHREVI